MVDLAFLPALSVLLGSASGALTSVATTWLAHQHQLRSQWTTQERGRRERIFSEFIDQASKAFGDALTHTSLEDPSKFVPLYATMGKVRLFASKRTIAAADAVMARIFDTYYSPKTDFKSQPSSPEREFDILLNFIEACRAELGSDSTGKPEILTPPMSPERLGVDKSWGPSSPVALR